MPATVILKLILRQSRQGLLTLAAAVVLAIFGMGTLVYGLHSQQELPRPPVSAAGQVAEAAPTLAPAASRPQPLDFSQPVRLTIPAIDVDSDLGAIGKNADGSIEVPKGAQHDKAAWYKYSPAPGQLGAAVIAGHVDSAEDGPSVFFKLGSLKPNDIVRVNRADGKIAVFKVDGVREYDRNAFPTELVYGPTDGATLRLITCSGSFNKSTGQYNKNIVVFASLLEVSPTQP